MKPNGPTAGSAPVVWASSGVECWLVKAQFSGILLPTFFQPDSSHCTKERENRTYQSLG
jgi:hypothetical protein